MGGMVNFPLIMSCPCRFYALNWWQSSSDVGLQVFKMFERAVQIYASRSSRYLIFLTKRMTHLFPATPWWAKATWLWSCSRKSDQHSLVALTAILLHASAGLTEPINPVDRMPSVTFACSCHFKFQIMYLMLPLLNKSWTSACNAPRNLHTCIFSVQTSKPPGRSAFQQFLQEILEACQESSTI